MKTIYIIKTGETFKNTKKNFGDFDDWVISSIGESFYDIKVIDILKGDGLPNLNKCDRVIITGSHSMVTDELDWSLKIEKWIEEAIKEDIPFLGICYGHQLMAKALGGKVGYNKKGKEIGTVLINSNSCVNDDILFKNIPNKFTAHTTHSQSVLELPENSISLAYNDHDPNHIVRFSNKAWGVQFHPEYDKTIMGEYIKEQKGELLDLGFDMDKLLNGVEDTPYSNLLIKEFIKTL